jgi:dTDP-4-amino-4,6-dideoxygalactose transaminase
MKILKNNFLINKKELIKINSSLSKMIKRGTFVNGPVVKKFEQNFSKKNKAKYCVGFSSSSTAISSVVNILNQKNNEILIPVFSPIPVAASLKNYNLNIRYVDVDKETFLLKSNLQNEIDSKTGIIMPVHLFGNVFDVNSLKKKISSKINIIEDSSQAHFSKINNNYVGSNSFVSIFSFYPTKNLFAYGDAGCVTTNNQNFAKKLRAYRNYGLHHRIDKLLNFGNNFRMDEFQAMILSMNLKKIFRFNTLRAKINDYYKYHLSDLPIQFQKIETSVKSNNHVFSIIVDSKHRNRLNKFLINSGIRTSIYYQKLLPSFTDGLTDIKLKKNFPNAFFLSKSIINLPIHPFLSLKETDYICKKIKFFFK